MTSPELPPQGRDARDALVSLHSEIGKAVVGHDGALTGLIIALVADGSNPCSMHRFDHDACPIPPRSYARRYHRFFGVGQRQERV